MGSDDGNRVKRCERGECSRDAVLRFDYAAYSGSALRDAYSLMLCTGNLRYTDKIAILVNGVLLRNILILAPSPLPQGRGGASFRRVFRQAINDKTDLWRV